MLISEVYFLKLDSPLVALPGQLKFTLKPIEANLEGFTMNTIIRKQKKAMISTIILIVVGILLGLTCTGTAIAGQKKYKWRMQSFYDPSWKWVAEQFTDAVYNMSNGRINITVYTGGQLLPTLEITKAVGKGVVEMGASSPGYVGSDIDVAALLYGIPYATDGYAENYRNLYIGGLLEVAREAYAEKGVYLLSILPEDSSELLMKKPARTLADLKGMKIRATPVLGKFFQKIGVNTVFIPFEETFVALQSGAIDGVVLGGAPTYYALQWHKTAKYLYPQKINFPVNCDIQINLKLWHSLSKADQNILQTAANQTVLFIATQADALEQVSIKKITEEGGELIYWSDSDMKKIKAASAEILAEEGQKSPRCSRAVEIIKGNYSEEVNASLLKANRFLPDFELWKRFK